MNSSIYQHNTVYCKSKKLSTSTAMFNNYQYQHTSPPLTPAVSPSTATSVMTEYFLNSTTHHKHTCQFEFCGWSFKRYEHLKRHMLVHTGEKSHTCHFPGCGKSFSRPDNFHAHYRTHTKKKQPTSTKKNPAIAKSSKNMRNKGIAASLIATNAAAAVHQQYNTSAAIYYSHHISSEGYSQPNQHSLFHTQAQFPTSGTTTVVVMSPQSPPTPNLSLLNHEPQQIFFQSILYPQQQNSYQILCQETAPSLITTDQISTPVGNSRKSHRCPVSQCLRKFKRLEHLKRHTRIHTLEKPFQCTVAGCQKRFSRSDNLTQHTKTHQNKRLHNGPYE